MRWNYQSRDDPDSYVCCLCCHVRTGTIMLGVLDMIVHVALLCFIVVMFTHPELAAAVQEKQSQLPISLNMSEVHALKWNNDTNSVALLVVLGSMVLTLLLIIGAVRGKANYLLPFFCMQVVDFVMACLNMLRSLQFDEMQPMQGGGGMQTEHGMMVMQSRNFLIFAYIIGLTLKAYMIGLVWSCYRYLTRYPGGIGQPKQFVNATIGADAEMLLPPKYEDAIQAPVYIAPTPAAGGCDNESPPPPYTN